MRFAIVLTVLVLAWAAASCDGVEDYGDLQNRFATAMREYDRDAALRVARSIGPNELSSEAAEEFVRLKTLSYSISGELSNAESTVSDYLRARGPNPELLTALGLIRQIDGESGLEAFSAAYELLLAQPIDAVDETRTMLELYVANWIGEDARDEDRIAALESGLSSDAKELLKLWRDFGSDGLIEYSPIGFVSVPYLTGVRDEGAEWWE